MRPPLRWQLTETLISSIQNVCFRTTFYVYHFNLKKRIYTSISIKYVDWCAKVMMQLQYSKHFYQCLHKSSTVRASGVHVLSVLLLLACFVISVRLIIPLYSHYRDQAPMEPRLGDHWPMGAQWGQSHSAAWLMAGTQPGGVMLTWGGFCNLQRLMYLLFLKNMQI